MVGCVLNNGLPFSSSNLTNFSASVNLEEKRLLDCLNNMRCTKKKEKHTIRTMPKADLQSVKKVLKKTRINQQQQLQQ